MLQACLFPVVQPEVRLCKQRDGCSIQKNNFKIVARNISGEAQAGYLIGGTFSMG